MKIIFLFLFLMNYLYSYTQNPQILDYRFKSGKFEEANYSDYSIGYSNWKENDFYKGIIFIGLNYGNFQIEKEGLRENYHLSLFYENLFQKKIYKNLYFNNSFGMAYGFFDYEKDSKGFSSNFTKFYLDFGTEYIKNNWGFSINFSPIIFVPINKENRDIFEQNLNLSYSIGLGLKKYSNSSVIAR